MTQPTSPHVPPVGTPPPSGPPPGPTHPVGPAGPGPTGPAGPSPTRYVAAVMTQPTFLSGAALYGRPHPRRTP